MPIKAMRRLVLQGLIAQLDRILPGPIVTSGAVTTVIVGCGVVIIIATCTPVILAEDAHHALLGDIRRAQDRLRAQHALVADIRQAQDSRRAHHVLMAPSWIRQARELHLVLNVQREGMPLASLLHAPSVLWGNIRI